MTDDPTHGRVGWQGVAWQGEEALRPLLVPIDSIRPHPRNPRMGDVGAMSLSLERFGQYRPAVVRAGTGPEAGEIVAGSHMWKAAKALGWTHLAVLPRVMDDEEAASLMLADNRVADRGSYDQGALADLLQDLRRTDGSLDAALGYDTEDLDDLLAALERTAPPPPLPEPTTPAAGPAVPAGEAPAPEAEPTMREVRYRLSRADADRMTADLEWLADRWDLEPGSALVEAVAIARAREDGGA